MNEKKESDCISRKDLLYSEILNSSVTSHVCDLFEKKQKICPTYPIQRSSVLDRASKFLISVDKVDENVQNIEDIEEGQPIIDMDVTLIKRPDSECDSELDLNDEDSDSETENSESTVSSDSAEEASEYKNMDDSFHDKSVHDMFEASSELSQNGSEDILIKNSKNKELESDGQKGTFSNQRLTISADSGSGQLDSGKNDKDLCTPSDSSDEQFKSENNEKMKVSDSAMSLAESNSLSELKNEKQDRKFLEITKPDFEHAEGNTSDSSCKYEGNKQSLEDLSFRKRKLIDVIEDDESSNLCLTKTQKVV